MAQKQRLITKMTKCRGLKEKRRGAVASYVDVLSRYVEQPTHTHKTTCSKCGMVWEGVMGYVCRNVDCPVQLKVT